MTGLAIGLAAAAANWALRLVLPALPVAALTLGLLVAGDRGRHLSGLAHAADAFGGAHTLKARQRIAADTRVGSFGTAAVTCVLLLQFAALASLPAPWLIPVIGILPLLARWPRLCQAPGVYFSVLPVFAITWGGALLIAKGGLVLALLTTLGVRALWALLAAAVMLALGAGAAYLHRAYLRSRLGGLPEVSHGLMVTTAETGWLMVAALVVNLDLF